MQFGTFSTAEMKLGCVFLIVVCGALVLTSLLCQPTTRKPRKKVILYENSCNQYIQCKWGECCRKKHNRTRCHRRPRYGGRCTNTSFRGIYKGYCDCFVSQGTCVNNRCI
uniref:Ixodegrin B n=1 Tax=Rhipicephalus appendiculatus TaxID=34631 RepID=A0A131Z647_RHIAP